MRHSGCRLILESLQEREISVFWDGWKARLDGVCPVGVVDLKTCRTAAPEDFSRAVYTLGYHIQAAFYLEAAAVAGLPADDFYIIAAESSAPYEAALYKVDHAAIEIGRRELARLKAIHARFQESQTWPGYSPEPQAISLPPWIMRKEIEGEI
jgi:hypothetical protein